MPRFVVIIILALAVATAAAAQQPARPANPDRLRERVDSLFARWDSTVSPGCALSVIKDGQVLYRRGYGMADLEHDVPIRPDTVFLVASVSKQFTAAAILLLAQEGKLSLDDAVHKYITELPDFGTPITIRQLLHHVSGLREHFNVLSLAGWRNLLDFITDDDILAVMARQKELNFPPGERHMYSNTGYALLAQIVQRVSGQSFREFTARRIFGLLDMKSTHFRDDRTELVKNLAYGYRDGRGRNVYRLILANFDTVGATGLLTTGDDLARWDANFFHPLVGGLGLPQQLLQRGKLAGGKELAYACGLIHGSYRGLHTIDHAGIDQGYRADLLRFPDQHFSVACLCNKGEINASDLSRKVADIYLADAFTEAAPARPEPAGKAVALSQQQLSQYAGLYFLKGDERTTRLVLQDGKLFVAESAELRMELGPITENKFQLLVYPTQFSFDRASPGAAWRLSSLSEGQEQPDLFEKATEWKPTPAQLGEYPGSYASAEVDPIYQVGLADGWLTLQQRRSSPQRLVPTVVDHFHTPFSDLHFRRDAAGKVIGFAINAARTLNFRFTKTAELRP